MQLNGREAPRRRSGSPRTAVESSRDALEPRASADSAPHAISRLMAARGRGATRAGPDAKQTATDSGQGLPAAPSCRRCRSGRCVRAAHIGRRPCLSSQPLSLFVCFFFLPPVCFFHSRLRRVACERCASGAFKGVADPARKCPLEGASF